MKDEAIVPEIIYSAGEHAVSVYREFLEDKRLSASTRRVYGRHVRRFLWWAASRELTIQSITAFDCAASIVSLTRSSAKDVLSVLRCFFRHLVGAGVLAVNPIPRDARGPREIDYGSGSQQITKLPSTRTEFESEEGVGSKARALYQIDARIATVTGNIIRLKAELQRLATARGQSEHSFQ